MIVNYHYCDVGRCDRSLIFFFFAHHLPLELDILPGLIVVVIVLISVLLV